MKPNRNAIFFFSFHAQPVQFNQKESAHRFHPLCPLHMRPSAAWLVGLLERPAFRRPGPIPSADGKGPATKWDFECPRQMHERVFVHVLRLIGLAVMAGGPRTFSQINGTFRPPTPLLRCVAGK